ncbi:rho guanine nucleotide exchange factor 12 isoform X2 [Neocloeon triangulifer]|uniref:rho guanine nucleotide exchange factor 12 isoform X2 n=1 Tax=Neocloeon triangulifer TaxID=2078957 RepID=UPI00286F2EB5|nr:rho guanine nucleotide exchange factor 12 isoform X2 [Neocloeon triangulifer]
MDSSPPSKSQDSRRKMRSRGARPVSAGSTSSTGSGDLPPSPLGGTVVVITVVMDQSTGYGMKVSGDKPVYVQSVRPCGSAEKAGLKPGDKILKVNGVNVTQSTHLEVVELIKADAQVILTVQQYPHPRPPILPSSPPGMGAVTKRKGTSSRENITGPQPVDLEERRKYESSRRKTFQLMLENEQRNIEALRSKLAVANEPKTMEELTKAENRLRTIQNQLFALIGPVDLYHNNSATGLSPPPLPPARPRPSFPSSPCSTPPALPPRNPPVQQAASCESNGVLTNNHSSTPTHQRTKSSPDPLGHSSLDGASRLSTLTSSESVQDLSRREKALSGGWEMDSPRITPPGTPPPPYGGAGGEMSPQVTDLNGPGDVSMMDASFTGPIISMEDDDMSDQEMHFQGHLEDHGPFKSANKLLQHPAHLSVFMNYVLSNSDPSSLLFYLITDLYKEGNAKEMKKWAYEIHSTFLVPDAPLRLAHVDENNAREVDEVLLIDSDKEEILRKVFWKPRSKSKETLSEQLSDFRQKRIAGLGAFFGATDVELEESEHDKSKELAIIEKGLLPHIEILLPKLENEVDGRCEEDVRAFQRASSICSSLCTLASKLFGLRGSNPLLERVPSFVCKDKTSKLKLLARNHRKVNQLGHTLHAHHYFIVTHCNHCGRIIGGVGPQGYQCSSCLLNIHRWCVRPLEEECPGPLKKDKHNDNRISKLMERIRPEREARRKPSSLNLEKIKKSSEERDELGNLLSDADFAGGARRADLSGSSDMAEHSAAATDTASGGGSTPQSSGGPLGARKPSATSINRSESYKERVQKRQLRERRKTSDPNLGSKSANNDTADVDALQFNNNSGSSSNSTHSLRSLDSPSTSMEMVTGSCAPGNDTLEGWDSDIEVEADPPDWTRSVEEEELRKLTSREKKRQEVINELFYTERSHVRALKVLDRIFYRPLLDNPVLPHECLVLLFPNLGEMLDIHGSLNTAMKLKRKESPIVGDISELLLNIFDGPAGERFQREAATFCANHQLALEMLKERRRKDQKLNNFLTDAEGKSVCRRLQLKDIIPFGFQRLTKYPLLFENLMKLCEGSERAGVQRALERSKEIVNHVNASVKDAADQHRLHEIQRRLDKGSFEKADHSLAAEFKNLDLTRHRLVHEGLLSWRQSKTQKPVDLHVVLLEEIIVLLIRQDDKFVLKFFSVSTPASADKSLPYSPIIKTSTVLTRPVATDKRAFFLVNMSQACAQIFELVALSNAERKTWSKHITDTADAARMKRENQRPRPDAPPAVFPHDNPIPEDSNKDAEEAADANNTENISSEGASSAPQEPESFLTNSLPEEKEQSGVVRRSSSAASSATNRDSVPRMVQECSLIQPSEVRVCQSEVHVAEPVYTPIELLRREDEAIRAAIRRKQKIVADLLHIPQDQYETIAELASEAGSSDKEQVELALACFHQVTRLTTILNENLRVTEEDSVAATSSTLNRNPPSISVNLVQEITTALTTHVTQLMVKTKMTKEREEEREMIRKENMRLREQVHAMLEQRRSGTARPKRRATSTGFSRETDLNLEETGDQSDKEEDINELAEAGAEDCESTNQNGGDKEDLVQAEGPANI